MTPLEQIVEKQRQLQLQFAVWMAAKKQQEVLTFRRANGDLVEHHPDGTEKVVQYAE